MAIVPLAFRWENPMVPAVRSDIVRACVVADGVTTHYDVGGRGDSLVVLTADHALGKRAFSRLPADRRVLVPHLEVGSRAALAVAEDFAAWLSAFMEALGLREAVTLVPDRAFRERATDYSRLDAGRVRVEPHALSAED